VDDETTGADLVSSDIVVPGDRTNGAGLDSRDHADDEPAAVPALADEDRLIAVRPVQTTVY